MAQSKGLVQIQGTLGGLTFYKSKGSYLVRTKGGVSKERIMNDPSFVRTRENGSEFGNSARSGKLFRVSANSLISKAKDGTLTGRVTQVMSKIKNLDLTSARGERTVALGIATAEGKQLLVGFNLNSRAHLSTVLRTAYALDPATGEVTIANLIPQTELAFPQHATHVSLSCGFLNLEFESGVYEMVLSHSLNLPIDMTSTNVVLTPSSVPAGVGIQFYFLLIEYFQMVNSNEYPLNNGAFNALGIIGVV